MRWQNTWKESRKISHGDGSIRSKAYLDFKEIFKEFCLEFLNKGQMVVKQPKTSHISSHSIDSQSSVSRFCGIKIFYQTEYMGEHVNPHVSKLKHSIFESLGPILQVVKLQVAN